ncbi:MAG: undecaprenyl/decaprenyl-phosphate alpha-N-acetylglucosaminyl 1-phosphate transferase [Sphingobacteriales bacterium]|nr:MAG: undecaprenyl/decaprenyl-phosphate alpha-N-acetylglucosaminyl 1-phosphate transferase [Sphingobacteriales bacterium]
MSNYIPPYLLYILIPLASAFICGFSIPRIIILAKRKRLFDQPDNYRKIHKEVVPNLGGVAIFFSYAIVACLTVNAAAFPSWNLIMAASLTLFVMGVKDDLITLTHSKKFVAQILAAFITVYFADIRLHSLHGIMGIHELPEWFSIAFSMIGCMFVTNAFNLIDGIDGLAGSISVLCLLMLGIAFAWLGDDSAAFVALSLMGAIIGFLKFNISPARIFMGDSGALVIGFTISILCILFINSFDARNEFTQIVHTPASALVVALAILFIPVFDSFRVFVTRIIQGYHPFHADRTHLHHYLLDLGFSHSHTVSTLLTANMLIIAVALYFQDLNPNIAIAIILLLTFGLFAVLYFMRKNRLAKTEVLKNRMAAKAEIIAVEEPVKLNGKHLEIESIPSSSFTK